MMSNCKTRDKMFSPIQVTVYAYSIMKTSKVPITTGSIKRSAEDTFLYVDNSGVLNRITSILEVSPFVDDSVFMNSMVRVAIESSGYSTIYLDKASHISFNNRTYVCTPGLYKEISKLFPRKKRDTFLWKPSSE